MRQVGLLLVVMGTVLMVGELSRAEQTEGPNYEHLKPLEPLIGHWRMEGQTTEGVKLVGQESSEWMFNKNFIHSHGWYRFENTERVDYRFVTRWDPERTMIVLTFSVSTGEYWERIGRYDPNTRILTSHEINVLPDATRNSADITVDFTNPNRLAWRLRNFQGPEPFPDLDITFTRVEQATKPLHEMWLDYLAGKWEFQFEDGRKGTATFHRVGTTPGVVFHGETDGFSIAGITGWRSDSQMLVEVDHFSPQPGVEGTLHREFPEITRDHLSGWQKYRTSDGDSGEHALVYQRLGDDEMTLTGTPINSPPWVVHFQRIR